MEQPFTFHVNLFLHSFLFCSFLVGTHPPRVGPPSHFRELALHHAHFGAAKPRKRRALEVLARPRDQARIHLPFPVAA